MSHVEVQVKTLRYMLKHPEAGLNRVVLLALGWQTGGGVAQALPDALLDKEFKGWAPRGPSGLPQHEAVARLAHPRRQQTLRRVLPAAAVRQVQNIVVLFVPGSGLHPGTQADIRARASEAIQHLVSTFPGLASTHNTAAWVFHWGRFQDLVLFEDVLHVNGVPVPAAVSESEHEHEHAGVPTPAICTA
jgi:hypothetical protein